MGEINKEKKEKKQARKSKSNWGGGGGGGQLPKNHIRPGAHALVKGVHCC